MGFTRMKVAPNLQRRPKASPPLDCHYLIWACCLPCLRRDGYWIPNSVITLLGFAAAAGGGFARTLDFALQVGPEKRAKACSYHKAIRWRRRQRCSPWGAHLRKRLKIGPEMEANRALGVVFCHTPHKQSRPENIWSRCNLIGLRSFAWICAAATNPLVARQSTAAAPNQRRHVGARVVAHGRAPFLFLMKPINHQSMSETALEIYPFRVGITLESGGQARVPQRR